MNPLFQMYGGAPAPSNMVSPIQKIGFIRQAMANPGQFIRKQFPDIPEEIANDPNRILGYLQQTRGIPDQRIQELINLYGGMR